MTRGLVRYQQTGSFHFLTFSCYHRLPYLGTDHARELFESALERMRRRHNFVVAGYVIMPEHVHLLVSEPRKSMLAQAVQAVKLSVSVRGHERPFRQARYYDFNVHSEGEAGREASLHAPQSGGSGTVRAARRLAMVKLSPLPDGRAGNRRDRIVMDGGSAGITTAGWVGNADGAGLSWAPSQVSESRPGAPRLIVRLRRRDLGHPPCRWRYSAHVW